HRGLVASLSQSCARGAGALPETSRAPKIRAESTQFADCPTALHVCGDAYTPRFSLTPSPAASHISLSKTVGQVGQRPKSAATARIVPALRGRAVRRAVGLPPVASSVQLSSSSPIPNTSRVAV